MAALLLIFIGACVWWFLRSLNRMFRIFVPKPKPMPFIQHIKAEEIKPDPVPTVTNIQNNCNTTQIVIIDNRPKD